MQMRDGPVIDFLAIYVLNSADGIQALLGIIARSQDRTVRQIWFRV